MNRHVWVEGGANGVWRLREYVTIILQRRLSEYELGDHLETKLRIRFDLGNKHFRDGVESCLRSKLIADDTFHLDPESSLRYLNFEGTSWDRETDTWVRTRPDMLISRSTGWAFEECSNTATALVDAAFATIKEAQDKRGLHQPSQIPEEAARMLDEAAQSFEELKFFDDLCRVDSLVFARLLHRSLEGHLRRHTERVAYAALACFRE